MTYNNTNKVSKDRPDLGRGLVNMVKVKIFEDNQVANKIPKPFKFVEDEIKTEGWQREELA